MLPETRFRWKICRRLFDVWRHSSVTSPDSVNCFRQKLRKRCSINYAKLQRDPPSAWWQSQKTQGGSASTCAGEGFLSLWTRSYKGKCLWARLACSSRAECFETSQFTPGLNPTTPSLVRAPPQVTDDSSKPPDMRKDYQKPYSRGGGWPVGLQRKVRSI